MASEIRVNKIRNRSGLGTVTFADTGVDLAGIVTATSFSGDGSALTGVASTENIRTNTNATFLQNVNVSGTSTIGGDVNIADKIVHIGDTDTAIRFSEANQIQFETAGVERLEIQQSEAVFNDGGADFNFRVEGDTDANLLHIDASADAIGVGAAPYTTGMKMEITRSTSDAFVNASDCVLRLLNTDNSANNNQTSLQFTTFTTGSGADSAIVSQAEDASGNSRLEFWTDTSNGMTEKAAITAAGNLQFNSGFGSVVTAYGVRAWADIYWNSGTPTARANGNVNSISDDGTGDMTISFSTAMPDTI